MTMQKPTKPAKPSKRRARIARILLCLTGVFSLYMGTSFALNGDVPAYRVFLVMLGIAGIVLGLVHLYIGVFGSDDAVVRLLGRLMESE